MSRKKTDEFGVAVADDIDLDSTGVNMVDTGDGQMTEPAVAEDSAVTEESAVEDDPAPVDNHAEEGYRTGRVVRLCNLREEPSPTAKISDVVFAGEEISLVEIVRTETAGEWGRAVAPPHGWISMKNVLVGG